MQSSRPSWATSGPRHRRRDDDLRPNGDAKGGVISSYKVGTSWPPDVQGGHHPVQVAADPPRHQADRRPASGRGCQRARPERASGPSAQLVPVSSAEGRRRMDQLIQTLIIGLANGLIFALVALGYTLVYGIIELINFAHGDVFMLGSMLAFFLIAPASGGGSGIFPITADTPAPAQDRRDPASSSPSCMVGDGHPQRRHRADRLQAAAQRAQAGPAHLGDRHELRPPERRPASAAAPTSKHASTTSSGPTTSCRAVRDHGDRRSTSSRSSSAIVTIPLLIALSWFVGRDPAGQGDARDRPGPRYRRPDGRRRQPDDRASRS